MDPYWTIGKITNRIDEIWDLVLDGSIWIPRIGHNLEGQYVKHGRFGYRQMMRVIISFTHVQTALNSVHRFMSDSIFAIVLPCGLGLCVFGII